MVLGAGRRRDLRRPVTVARRRAGIFLEDLALPFTVKIMNRLKNDYYVSTFFPFLPEAV